MIKLNNCKYIAMINIMHKYYMHVFLNWETIFININYATRIDIEIQSIHITKTA